MHMKSSALIAAAFLLGACSGGEAPAPQPGTVSEGNVFKDDVDALAKAKQAEMALQEAAERQRAAIEADQ
jgi:hypothetical protein